MERFNRHLAAVEENKRLQTRVSELEAENEKLKNRNDFVKELISLLANFNLPRTSGIKQEGVNSLEQVIELAKDLSNDVRNIMKTINNRN